MSVPTSPDWRNDVVARGHGDRIDRFGLYYMH